MNNHPKQPNGNGHRNSTSSTGYTLYVPLNYNTGRRIEPELLKWIRSEVRSSVGASTEFYPSVGFWTSPSGEVFRDEMLPIQVVTSSSLEAERWFTRFAKKLAVVLEQQSIFLIAQYVRVLEATSPAAAINNVREHDEQLA